MTARTWRVPEDRAGERLDRALAAHAAVPRNQVRGWIETGRVLVDGGAVDRPGRIVRSGEVVVFDPPPALETRLVGEPGELALLHADDHLIVVDKPPGLVMHPGAGRSTATLAHRLLGRFPELAGVGGPGRPGIVHRLDRDTSGVVVVARNAGSYDALARAFAERRVEKRYLAIVRGVPRPASGEIDRPIARHAVRRKEMAVRSGGRRALTLYRTLATAIPPLGRSGAPSWSLLELDLRTGRTHQIRVHLKHLGHPIAGDTTYGDRDGRGAPRLALHAALLAFDHPADGERRTFRSPLPGDLAAAWRRLAGSDPPVDFSPA